MASINYYSYKELKEAVKGDCSEQNLKALGEWFKLYGSSYWNGECWAADELGDLYPVVEMDENDIGKIVAYELR